MEESTNNTRIEFLLKKDKNTEMMFSLNQCDYSFSNDYYSEEEDRRPMEVNLSGAIKNAMNPLFISWVANQAGEWSGSLSIYRDNKEKPSVVLAFDKALVAGCSQSFSEYNTQSYEAYFNAILKGVSLNDVKLS